MQARKHLPTVLIAVVVSAVTAGAPAIADGVRHALFSHNSDKVDGKHAVSSGASLNSAAGKLVATDRSGANKGRLSAKFLPRVSAAAVSRTGDLVLTNLAVTKIPFDAEEFDNAGMHNSNTNPTRLTARSAGLYHVSVAVGLSPSASGYRQISILKNNIPVEHVSSPHTGSYFTNIGVDAVLRLARGDFVEVTAFYDSDDTVAALGTTSCSSCTNVTIHRIGQ